MFKNITGELQVKINSALALNKGGNNKKVDSKAEYDALSQLLSRCEENSEAYEHIDMLMETYSNNVTQDGMGNVNGNNNDVSITINQFTVDQSRERGEQLADILVGLSDGDEYPTVRRIINKDINADNVMEVLRGYEDRRPNVSKFTNGNHFFEQLFRESSFDRKDETLKTMARYLRDYFAKDTSSIYARRIDIILNKSELTIEDVKKLDDMYMAELGD